MPKLTKRYVESHRPKDGDYIVWDERLQGFGVRIWPSGKKVYMLKYRNKNGRQRKPNIGMHGIITCEQARNIAEDWLAEVRSGGDPSQRIQDDRKAKMVRDLYEMYMQDYSRKYKKPRSIEEDERLWRLYILPRLGNLPIKATVSSDIKAMKDAMHDKQIAFNRARSVLHKAFELCEDEWGLRPPHSNPCKAVKKYKESQKERFLTNDEMVALSNVLAEVSLKGTESPAVVAAIRLLVLTGARLSEILTLKWEYIDFERGIAQLPDSKTGKKPLYLSPAALEVVASVEKEATNPYLIRGQKPGNHLVNLQKPWRRIRKKAGIEDVRLHDLRHNFASRAAASGFTLQMIGKLLGHRQIKTSERYAHLVGDPVQAAASDIGNRIAASMSGQQATVVKLRK